MSHPHPPTIPWVSEISLIPIALMLLMGLFLAGLPIPVGYDRGKVKWVSWCGTGMHAHTVYLTENGFQTLHPEDST